MDRRGRRGLAAQEKQPCQRDLVAGSWHVVGQRVVATDHPATDRLRRGDDLELRLSSDVDGVAEREEARREQRSLRIGRRADGMGYASWTLDPESFALVSEVYDRLTAPQRRVPSFDDDGGVSAETARLGDERTDAQRASDGFVELLRQGVAADPGQMLGDGPIGVRVLVAAQQLDARRGRGFLDGQHDPVSLATVERIACGAGTVALLIDAATDNAGQPLNLGRERRLFSRAQRVALAARDGGCRWPGCERPPSWCEAHHIEHWQRDGGRTDVADGIAVVTMHRPEARNALNTELRQAVPRTLRELDADPDVRVMILTGTDPAFCAGLS